MQAWRDETGGFVSGDECWFSPKMMNAACFSSCGGKNLGVNEAYTPV